MEAYACKGFLADLSEASLAHRGRAHVNLAGTQSVLSALGYFAAFSTVWQPCFACGIADESAVAYAPAAHSSVGSILETGVPEGSHSAKVWLCRFLPPLRRLGTS